MAIGVERLYRSPEGRKVSFADENKSELKSQSPEHDENNGSCGYVSESVVNGSAEDSTIEVHKTEFDTSQSRYLDYLK